MPQLCCSISTSSQGLGSNEAAQTQHAPLEQQHNLLEVSRCKFKMCYVLPVFQWIFHFYPKISSIIIIFFKVGS